MYGIPGTFTADEDPASFECLVPGEPEVSAIDLPMGTKPSPLRTHGSVNRPSAET